MGTSGRDAAAGLTARLNRAWHGSPVHGASLRALGTIGFWVARPGLDAAYQQHLATLTRARRAVAEVATSRKRLELRISELERQAGAQGGPGSGLSEASPDGPGSDLSDASPGRPGGLGQPAGDVAERLAGLRGQYADQQTREERMTAASQRLMREVSAFRASKAAAQAAHTAVADAAETVRAEAAR
jgi:phage shock protein A